MKKKEKKHTKIRHVNMFPFVVLLLCALNIINIIVEEREEVVVVAVTPPNIIDHIFEKEWYIYYIQQILTLFGYGNGYTIAATWAVLPSITQAPIVGAHIAAIKAREAKSKDSNVVLLYL